MICRSCGSRQQMVKSPKEMRNAIWRKRGERSRENMGSRMEIGLLDDTGLKMTENLLWVEFLVKKDDKKKKEPISSFFFMALGTNMMAGSKWIGCDFLAAVAELVAGWSWLAKSQGRAGINNRIRPFRSTRSHQRTNEERPARQSGGPLINQKAWNAGE